MADEISKEALLIYLDNIRTLETILYESKSRMINIGHECYEKSEEIEKNIQKPPAEPKLEVTGNDDSNEWIIAGVVVLGLRLLFCRFNILLIIGILLIIIGIIIKLKLKADSKRNSELNRINVEHHKESLNKYEIYRQQEQGKIYELRKKADKAQKKIQEEMDSFNKILNKAYSQNIIPLQFRNLTGVFYLYDYLSTSNESLSNALMQCNLEAIKQQLDKIIRLQSKAIIQQAQANAALYEQNQRILEAAQATMENTAVAAKYAQISAINSILELRMKGKRLAYQKLDYWYQSSADIWLD